MKFFVTGGAGFIGSALVSLLSSSGHESVVYDTFERGRREYVAGKPGVSLVEGDVRDRARIAAAVAESRPEYVIHLAALHFIPDCIARPAVTLDINVAGTQSVFDACRFESVRGIGFASSAAVYVPHGAASTEETAIGPLDIYGESKVRGEAIARAHFAATGTPITLFRIFNAIGPRETNPHLIPHILESLRGTDLLSLGNITPKRDYIDTRDLATAMLAIAPATRGCDPVNLGTGVAHSVAEIVELLGQKLGRPLTVNVDPKRVRATDNPLLLADLGKVQKQLAGWPAHDLGSSLDELIAHYELPIGPRPSSGN